MAQRPGAHWSSVAAGRFTVTDKPFMPDKRLVEVLWDDAHSQSEQLELDGLAEEQYVCTVGYVVKETDRSIWVSCEILDGGDVRGTTRIPLGMVVEVRELRRVKKRRPRIGDAKA